MRRHRKHASDRRLERRLARKVSKTGQKCSAEVFEAYLAGLQQGLEIQEKQQAVPLHVPYRDIFGNEIPSMKMRDRVDEDDGIRSATTRSVSLH